MNHKNKFSFQNLTVILLCLKGAHYKPQWFSDSSEDELS